MTFGDLGAHFAPTLGSALRDGARECLPGARHIPEVVGLSVAHAAARCAAPGVWPRLFALVMLAAVAGPARWLPVHICQRLVPRLLRRKVASTLARIFLPTVWREVAVLGRIAPIQLAYLATSLRVRELDEAEAELRWDETHEWATPRIRAVLDDFGGFLRKIGQMLGTATPSMPPKLMEAFADSMDNCAGLPFWAVKHIIEHELRAPLSELFESVDEEAAATASIAQVHFGVLRADGSPVAIKVACVSSKRQMLSDMRTMLRAAIVLRRLKLDGGIDMPTIMRSYWDIVPEEFDLTIEARKMRRFEAAFERAGLSEHVGMARAHPTLCTQRVLVMSRLMGTPMLDFCREARESGGPPPCPPEVVELHGGWAGLVHALHLAWGVMVLVEGAFHTDPHPGNLLLLPDGKVGILDWGQTKHLRPEHVEMMCRVTLAMAGERYAEIERLIEDSGEFELEELAGRSAIERRMAWVLICYTFVDTRWTPLCDINLSEAPSGMLGKNRLSRNSQEAFPLIRAIFLLRGLMASLGVSTSMAVAWEPLARRTLLQRGVPVEPYFLVVARRQLLSTSWLAMRWLLALVRLCAPSRFAPPAGGDGSRRSKELAAVVGPNPSAA